MSYSRYYILKKIDEKIQKLEIELNVERTEPDNKFFISYEKLFVVKALNYLKELKREFI